MAQGVGHLDIGTGIGDAQVFNPHPAIQQYGDMLAAKKAKHEADVKMLGAELAKGYDPSVLRNDADRQSYLKQYGDIKNQAIEAENEKDPNKKALALAGVRQQLSNLGSFAEGSKKQGALERQLAMAHLQNRFLFDDNSAQRLKDGMQKVWNDGSVIKDPSELERGIDPAKIDAEYEKHKNTILKGSNATYDNGTLSPVQNILGKKTATLTQNRIVPYQEAYEHTLNYATSDNDYQKFLHDKYSNIKADNPQDELALRVKADMEARGDDRGFYDKPKVKEVEGYKPPEPDKFYEHYNYELAHPKPSTVAQQQSNTPIYRQKWVDDILHGDETSRKEAAAKISVDPSYDGKLGTGVGNTSKTQGQLVFDVPAKIRYDKDGAIIETVPKHRVWIDPKDPNSKVKLNELLNEVTGEKVDISQLETPGGKKHIGTPSPTQTYKAGGKTYSHKQLLDLGYTEEQIQEAKKLGTLK